MKEKTVRSVMIKYFASKGIKTTSSRSAGPDLHIDGKAVEVKGSKFDFDRMVRQLVDYAYKYSDVSLVLPFDSLNLKKANQIHKLAQLIERARKIRLKVYVVAPDLSYNNLFYVRELDYVHEIPFQMQHLGLFGLSLKDPDSTIHEAVENLIKYSPSNELKNFVCSELTRDVSKVQI